MAGSGVPLRLHTVGVQAPRGESTVLVRCPVLCRDANRFVEAVGGGEHLEQYLRRHRGSSDGSGPDSLNFALRPGSRGARPLKGATELVDAVVLKVVTRRYRSGRKERVVKPVRVAGRMVHFSGAADLQYLTRAELGVPEPLPALNPADAAPPSGFDATSEARAGAYYKEHHDQVAKEGGVAQGAPAASTPQSIGTLQVSEAACSLDASDQVDKDVSAHRVCDLLEHEVECLPDAFFGATPPAPPATEPDSLFLGHAPGGRSATWDALKIVLAFHDECPAPVQAVPAALARPARSEVISAPRAHTLLSERHAVTTLHRHMRELRAHVALLRLFRARPVWTPRALCTYVRPGILPPRPALPRFLRRVAYFSRMVPWRGCWIRCGPCSAPAPHRSCSVPRPHPASEAQLWLRPAQGDQRPLLPGSGRAARGWEERPPHP